MTTARPSSRHLASAYDRLGGVPAVALELGVAYETARQWLLEAGVELKPKGRPSKRAENLNVAELASRYTSGTSIATLGKTFGVSPNTVRNRLLGAEVTLRPRRGWPY